MIRDFPNFSKMMLLFSFPILRPNNVIFSFYNFLLVVSFSLSPFLFPDCLENFKQLFRIMADEVAPSSGAVAGTVSGNETTFCYTDDDVIHSEVDAVTTSSGW